MNTAWYRHRWPWFIVSLLGGSVLLSGTMLVLAIRGQDSLVNDRYYDAGKGINRELSQDLLAHQLGQQAELVFDSLTGEVRLRLRGSSKPAQVRLNVISPTQPERDQAVRLVRSSASTRGIADYRGQLAEPVEGRHSLELLGNSKQGTWRLYDQARLVPDHSVNLGDDAPAAALKP
jgi:hypothetical protein